MGTYVEFLPCPPAGPLGQIVACADEFLSWYTGPFAEEADTHVLELLLAVTQRGEEALLTVPQSRYESVDKLVTQFYGIMCDTSKPPAMPSHVSCSQLRVERYKQLHQEMGESLTTDISELWEFIYKGRPVAPPSRRSDYVSDDDASWVSWWSLDEVRTLSRSLPPRSFVGSELTGGVLMAVHTALDDALQKACGLVVTAF